VLTVLCALGFSARTRRKAGLASAAAEVPRDCDGPRTDGVALRCWRATCAAIQRADIRSLAAAGARLVCDLNELVGHLQAAQA
jgi:hypothetical protein